jgi:hypothetical protein
MLQASDGTPPHHVLPCPHSCLQYKKAENQFYIFADDTVPRFVTSVLPLDFDTFAVADKFGNLGVLRLPADVSAQVGGASLTCLEHYVFIRIGDTKGS